MTQWTVPQPPRPGNNNPIRTGKVWIGIGYAIAAHLASILLTILLAFVATGDDAIAVTLFVGLGGQFVVFVGCLTFGIIWIARYDRGIGVGLLIGWAVGVLVLPVVGFGLCVWALNQSGGFG